MAFPVDADGATTNYSLIKPYIGKDPWYQDNFDNLDAIDAQMKTNADGIATNVTDIATNVSLLAAHKTQHQNGGTDEIDLTGLEGTNIKVDTLTEKTADNGIDIETVHFEDQRISNLLSPVDDDEPATKSYVDTLVNGLDWQESIIDQIDFTAAEPAAPSTGDRYINTGTGNSSVTTQAVVANYIYQWNGTDWTGIISDDGTATFDESDNYAYYFDGSSWVKLAGIVEHNNLSTLQGGTSAEYYHLTAKEYTDLGQNKYSAKVNEGAGITVGQWIYISGATGQFPQVSLGDNTSSTKDHFSGIATETKTDGQTIIIAVSGEITGIDTDTIGNDGDPLYLSTGGDFVTTAPTSGSVQHVGHISYDHASTGKILITNCDEHGVYTPSGVDIIFRMGDSGATNKILFKDYANAEVASLDSDGKAIFTQVSLGDDQKLYFGAVPDGSIEWNNTDSMLNIRFGSISYISLLAGECRINEASEDVNFIILGTSDPNLLSCDVGEDKVGIGLLPDTGDEKFSVVGNIQIGNGGAGVDYYLLFDGETNDGKITWMEDEARFDFDSNIHLPDDKFIYLGNDNRSYIQVGAAGNGLNFFGNANGVWLNETVGNGYFGIDNTSGAFFEPAAGKKIVMAADNADVYVGIGIAAPLAKVHIDQSVVDAAIPVLILDQADVSEGFINFIGSDRGIITGATDSLKSVRVELGGVVYRLALYADA